MTTSAQLRKAATGLPGAVAEGDAFGVGGVVFAALVAPGLARLNVTGDDAAALRERYGATDAGEGVTIRLADIDGRSLNAWVHRAWLACAPADLVRRSEADGGDFPKAIGRPAARALALAGITTVDQARAWSDAELLALHGFGPKALRLLRAAAEEGRGFSRGRA